MNGRVLFIAYHYPPENAIGAARPYRFTKYLARLGYQCHVITAADTTSRPDLAATYIPDPSLHASDRGLGFQCERVLRKLLIPGAIGVHWSHLAYRAGLEYVEKHSGDPITIFSTFPPLGVHMAAFRLARAKGIPWIADFRDPMGHNPIYRRLGRHTLAAYSWMEARIVRHASAIVANTDGSEAILRCHYPDAGKKIHLLWNGFDPEQRLRPLPLPSRPYRLYTHTGELYEGRTIAPVLESIQRLFNAGKLAAGSIRVDLIGPMEPECLPPSAFLDAATNAGWLSITPRQIPKPDAQLGAQTADGLLIVQPQSAVQVPGKVYDYLQIGRPLLAFLPPASTVERLLSQAGVPYRCVYTTMSPEASDAGMLEYLNLPSEPAPASSWFEDTFSAPNQTAHLASIIESVQRNRAPHS